MDSAGRAYRPVLQSFFRMWEAVSKDSRVLVAYSRFPHKPCQRAAMCWRQLSKLQRSICIVLGQFCVYLYITYQMTPEPVVTFLPPIVRVGDKYSLMYLVAGPFQTFTTADSINVFESRHCERCFITNNKGFLPKNLYDAIVIYGNYNRSVFETAVFPDERRYIIDTTKQCIAKKFNDCPEPVITSVETKEKFDFCGLCNFLNAKRLRQRIKTGRY